MFFRFPFRGFIFLHTHTHTAVNFPTVVGPQMMGKSHKMRSTLSPSYTPQQTESVCLLRIWGGSLQTVKMEPSTLRDHRVTFNLYNPIQTNDLAEKEVVAISFADIMCLCSEREQAHVCVCLWGKWSPWVCSGGGQQSITHPLPHHSGPERFASSIMCQLPA